MSSVQEVLEERGVKNTASPDVKMMNVMAYHLGDTHWWDQVKAWMAETGYLSLRKNVLDVRPDDIIVVHCPENMDMEAAEKAMTEVLGEDQKVLLMQGSGISVLRNQ